MVEAVRKISIYTRTERSQMESTSHIYFTTQKKPKKTRNKNKQKNYTQNPQKPFVRNKFQIRKFKNYQVSFTSEIQRPKTSFQSRSK